MPQIIIGFDFFDNVLCTIATTISTIACIWLLYSYSHLTQRSTGLKLIVILGIADLTFHSTQPIQIWTWYCESGFGVTLHSIVHFIGYVSQRFSILWAAVVAILVYNIFVRSYREKQLYISLVIVTILSIAFSIMTMNFGLTDGALMGYFSQVVPLLASSIIGVVYYYKSVIFLKHHMRPLLESVKPLFRKLYLYALVQVFSVAPLLISLIIRVTSDSGVLKTIAYFPVMLTGLANASVFLFMKKQPEEDIEDEFLKF